MLPEDQPRSPFNPYAQRPVPGNPPASSPSRLNLGSLTGSGSMRLFRVFGITVFLHWSWFLVAVYQVERQSGSVAWNIAEYLALFAIVLLHEFGHALACRSVGGQAERIVLWPLGGVAFVQPPARPGALLWSIFAGPLVNIILVPITWILFTLAAPAGTTFMEAFHGEVLLTGLGNFAWSMVLINGILLAFNLLPIYPLDGGQILQALLWFVIGRAWSLMVAACVGLAGAIGVLCLAAYEQSIWFAILAFFGGSMAWRSIRAARILLKYDRIPRRPEAICPHCGKHPVMADRWTCGNCGHHFDALGTGGMCPQCGRIYGGTICFDCGQSSPIAAWGVRPAPSNIHPVIQVGNGPDTMTGNVRM